MSNIYTLKLEDDIDVTAKKEATLVEPKSNEIFNIALVQKGWPASLRGYHMHSYEDLQSAIIYKEYISHIDYQTTHPKDQKQKFYDERKAIIDTADEYVLPTDGSRDGLGASPQTSRQDKIAKLMTVDGTEKDIELSPGSEINKTGIGGGSVFTIDGITFGLEVCRDHFLKKLSNFCKGTRKDGDPEVQIQLIPSWGMSIKEDAIACMDEGLIFNVDGPGPSSTLVVKETPYYYDCRVHPKQDITASGNCTQANKEYYKCNICNHWGETSVFCSCFGNVISGYVRCGFCRTLNQLPTTVCTKPACAKPLDKCNQPLKLQTPPDIYPTKMNAPTQDRTCFGSDGKILFYGAKAIPKAKSV